MASKFGLAGGIPERRVRPIWDAVDSRQFKAALKLCVALLTKYPNSPYALALKALILERMGKPEEALNVCLDAKELLFSSSIIHMDDLTLSTLQIVLQRLDRLDLATSCYEHACGKYPNNLEIIMGLFNCYVREYSFVKQQQTAIKMYKIVGEERFLLWAVCSIQLQVFCSSGGEKLLALAEALLKKHISSHSLHEPEALVIYISVLEHQAKYKDALEILSGDLGSLIGIEADKLRIQGRLHARSCDYAAAADIFQKVLESCPDDWESFLHYLGCFLEDDIVWSTSMITDQNISPNFADTQACNLTEEVFDERISNALSFIEKLQLEVANDYVRCPFLATIEIEKRRRMKGKTDDGKFVEVLLNYFHRFSHLSCFTSDVEMYLPILTHYEKTDLLEKLMRTAESPLATPLKNLGQAITIFKIQELLGAMRVLPVRELEDTAMRMVGMYYDNLSLSKDLDPQENMHGEELLSMASSALVLLFWRTRHLGYLLEAILVLEFGLTVRRYVWQYKIPLLHLYSYMGALPMAYEWYGTLDVKNILLETISHHILPQMLRSPFFLDTADLLKEYLKFMDDHLRESADLTFLAYRHRNYSKAVEFVQFKERLQHSQQYLMARLEASILQLKQKENLEEVECILENISYGTQSLELSTKERLESLTFNDDLEARPWWSPSSDVNYLSEPFEAGSSSLRMNLHKVEKKEGIVRKHIERKSLLPRMVYLSIRTASSSLKEIVEPNGSIVNNNMSYELKHLLERYAENIGLPFDDAKDVILGIVAGQKSFKDFGADVVDCINFAIFLNAWNSCSHHWKLPNGDGCSLSSWHIVDSLVRACITEQLMCSLPILTSPGSNLPVLVQLVTESFSWHILVIQSCLRSMIPQGKKKKRSAMDQSNLPQVKAIRASIECLISAVQGVRKWLADQIVGQEDEKLDVLLSHVKGRELQDGPGRVFKALEDYGAANHSELGERISGSLQSWSSADVLRKFAGAQKSLLSRFHGICDAKLKVLESLKQSV